MGYEEARTEQEEADKCHRGLGNQVLYEVLELLGWDYNIRFRGTIPVRYNGESRPASEWLPPSYAHRISLEHIEPLGEYLDVLGEQSHLLALLFELMDLRISFR